MARVRFTNIPKCIVRAALVWHYKRATIQGYIRSCGGKFTSSIPCNPFLLSLDVYFSLIPMEFSWVGLFRRLCPGDRATSLYYQSILFPLIPTSSCDYFRFFFPVFLKISFFCSFFFLGAKPPPVKSRGGLETLSPNDRNTG